MNFNLLHDRTRTLVGIALPGILLCALQPTLGQDLKAPPPQVATSEHVDADLTEMAGKIPLAQRSPMTQEARERFLQMVQAKRIELRKDNKVLVEIIGPDDGDLERDLDFPALQALGLEIGEIFEARQNRAAGRENFPLTRTAHRTEAWLPLAAIERMEGLLPKGYRVKPVRPMEQDAIAGEGPSVTNSLGYVNAGSNGNGLTIAVIDSGYRGLTAARDNGDAPTATLKNYTSNEIFESGSDAHGTGCVEAAFDHAPGATWRLYRINSSADYSAVISDCIANGVDIISHSLSRYNEGWGDNSGISCQEANRAAQNGILFFTSCGNRAQSHYEGLFVDADGDGFHEFGPSDETINITINTGETGGTHYLSWSNSQSDFDFFLYDSTMTTVLASGTTVGAGVFESFSGIGIGTYHLGVWRRSGPANSVIEIFSHNSGTWGEHIVAAGSSTSPSNSTNPLVISVGAVTQSSYGSANGSGVISGYSSMGPSNGGMTLPDICGPTDTWGFTYPGGFGGTSCATPNAAGAACAFWSSDTNLTANAVRYLLFAQAGAFRDWGPVGVENTYGAGGLRLVNRRAGTRWLARNYPGTLDNGTVPFQTVAGAYANVPNAGRLIILGANYGTYPEPVQLGSNGKVVDLETLPNTSAAVLGQ